MTRTIWKFPLTLGQTVVMMPKHSVLVHIAAQNGTVCVWAEVHTQFPEVVRRFVLIGTGHEPPIAGEYVGTAIVGEFVWHVFEEDDQ